MTEHFLISRVFPIDQGVPLRVDLSEDDNLKLPATYSLTQEMIFDFDKLGALKLQEVPFRYLVHDASILDPEILEKLCEDFPETPKVGHNDAKDLKVGAEWKAFTEEIYSPAYRKAMERITGLQLSGYEVGIGIRRLSKLSHGAPHADVPRKKVTHLIYFNQEWPFTTGRLRVLRSKNLEDVHETITPLKGTGLIFVVSQNSFHGFEPFEGIRKAIQINFEKTGFFSKLFEKYE